MTSVSDDIMKGSVMELSMVAITLSKGSEEQFLKGSDIFFPFAVTTVIYKKIK